MTSNDYDAAIATIAILAAKVDSQIIETLTELLANHL